MKYILFGAAQYMRDNIDEEKIKYFDYIVDSSPEKIGTEYLGKKIKAPSALLEENKNEIFIFISEFNQMYSTEYDLKKMGFEKGKNFDWLRRMYNYYPEHSLWLRRRSESWEKDESAWRAYSPVGTTHERAELVAKMIDWRGTISVLDLGAGSEPMRPLLPAGVTYYPVDYKQLTGNTLIYDFNQKQFPDIRADVVILVGVWEYTDYGVWLVDKAMNAVNIGGQFIVSLYYSTGNFSALDCIVKYHDALQLMDYAIRDNEWGIFHFKRVK